MKVTVLYPFFDHPAIEERYASWQSRMLFDRASDDVVVVTYDPRKSVASMADEIDDPHVIVVTDPLLVPSAGLADRLDSAMQTTGAEAAVPVTNEAANERQRVVPATPYLTMPELEASVASLPSAAAETVTWDDSNPGLFFCPTAALRTMKGNLSRALAGKKVAIARNAYVHRWAGMRTIVREDLLPLIDKTAKSILEIGCGQGSLGELVKARQKCRYVGIEIDRDAVAIARKRLDDVYCGDINDIAEILHEQFESIVCSEIIEHVTDPWSLLSRLREACKPGGQMVISIPNIANAAIIKDLLSGRFDYTYVGLLCVGHLRFFTRRSIEELMAIAGWQVESILPQHAPSAAGEDFVRQLEAAGLPLSRDDVLPTGFYVSGRNDRG